MKFMDKKNKEKKNETVFSQEQKNALSEMCLLLSRKNEPDFIENFFNQLFTPAELKDFTSRWLLLRALESGMTQREIAQKYHISLCKITRGSRELKKTNGALKLLIDEASRI